MGVTNLKTTTEKLSSELGEGVKISLQLIHLNRDTSDLGGGGGGGVGGVVMLDQNLGIQNLGIRNHYAKERKKNRVQ